MIASDHEALSPQFQFQLLSEGGSLMGSGSGVALISVEFCLSVEISEGMVLEMLASPA